MTNYHKLNHGCASSYQLFLPKRTHPLLDEHRAYSESDSGAPDAGSAGGEQILCLGCNSKVPMGCCNSKIHPCRIAFKGTDILVGDFRTQGRRTDLTDVGKALIENQYQTAKELTLYFHDCTELSDVSALSASLAYLAALQKLSLHFTSCEQLSDLSLLGTSVGRLTALQELILNFSWCKQLSDGTALGLGSILARLTMLQLLRIDFTYWSLLSDVTAIGESLAHLTALQHLNLNFSDCMRLSDVSAIGLSLAQLTKLQILSLNFEGCSQLSDVSVLGASLVHLTALQKLSLNFSDCKQLSDVSAIGLSLAFLTKLQSLSLNFFDSKRLSDLSALGASLAHLTKLFNLSLNFSYCSQLLDVAALGASLAHLKALRRLSLNFYQCRQLSDVSAVGASLARITAVHEPSLDFSYCSQLAKAVRKSFKSRREFLKALSYTEGTVTKLSPCQLDFSPLQKSSQNGWFGKHERSECTRIAGAENRGMTRGQLRRLGGFLLSHANGGGWLDGWTDLAPLKHSLTSGRRLNAHSINLYQVNTWIIIASTERFTCSFVEFVCDGDPKQQIPKWFCSHWWGESVLCFIKAVDAHAATRGIDAAMWICAYSNNQHELGIDITKDPRESSFFRAMQKCEGVLLILDAHATPFKRSWCAFELSMCMLETDQNQCRRLKLDVAVGHGAPQIIAEGLESGSDFPLALLLRGLKIDIANSEASREEDKKRILNSVCDVKSSQLDNQPPSEHPKYDEVNRTLQNLFAEAAMAADEKNWQVGNGLELCNAMQVDKRRTKLCFNFSEMGTSTADDVCEAMRRHLCETVTDLTMHFRKCSQLSDVSALGASLSHLTALQELSLNFNVCSQLSDVMALGASLVHLMKLQKLSLSFSYCSQLSDVWALGGSLAHLTALQELSLDFSHCSLVEDVTAFGSSLAQLTALQELNLNFYHCTQLRDVAALGASLAHLKALQQLTLNFKYCSPLEDVSALGASLGHLRVLHKLSLNFSDCKQLAGVAALGVSLGHLTLLQQLNINFKYCSQLPDVSALGASLSHLTELRELVLTFSYCSQLAGVSAVCSSLAHLTALQMLNLKFHGCSQLLNVSALGASLAQLTALRELSLNFTNCKQLAGVSSLGASLGHLTALQLLSLDFTYCTQLSDVSELRASLANLTSLRDIPDLRLDFSDCKLLSEPVRNSFQTSQNFLEAFSDV